MIDVFSFLLRTTFRNRITRRIARLREPRYLVPFVVSLLWLGTWVLRPLLRGSSHFRVADWSMLPADLRPALIFVGGVAIFVWIALIWILPDKKAALSFSPAELHFLFPAPVTRRQLVQYKLLQAQIGILFGVLVSGFFFGVRFLTASGLARLFALWLFFAIGHLHGIAASFVRTDLMESGWSAVKRRALSIAVALVMVLGVFFTAREPWNAIATTGAAWLSAKGHAGKAGLQLLHALAQAGTTGPASVILWPFLALPRLLLATTQSDFLRYGAFGLAMLLLHYVWVMRSDTSFEEASLELSQKAADRRAARQGTRSRGGRLVKHASRFPWKLAPTGAPETALVWKNLVNLTRVTPMRALFALFAFMLFMIPVMIQLSHEPGGLWAAAAAICAFVAAFSAVLGPIFVRNDLREDLFRIDAIKTMPLPGHAIVWAEILGAWTALALIEVVALGLGAIALSIALWISKANDVQHIAVPWLYWGAGAGLILLPAVTLVAVALQNTLVVLFPAWVALGNSRARGFEASGQRILTLFASNFVLSLAGLPPAILGGTLTWLLAPRIGPPCMVFGAVLASAWMVGEVLIASRLLGKLVDRLDPSTAGIEADEG